MEQIGRMKTHISDIEHITYGWLTHSWILKTVQTQKRGLDHFCVAGTVLFCNLPLYTRPCPLDQPLPLTHWTWEIPLHFTLHNLDFALHSTLYALLFTHYTPHSTLCTPHSPLCIFTLHTVAIRSLAGLVSFIMEQVSFQSYVQQKTGDVYG